MPSGGFDANQCRPGHSFANLTAWCLAGSVAMNVHVAEKAANAVEHYDVLIAGAGISGLG